MTVKLLIDMEPTCTNCYYLKEKKHLLGKKTYFSCEGNPATGPLFKKLPQITALRCVHWRLSRFDGILNSESVKIIEENENDKTNSKD